MSLHTLIEDYPRNTNSLIKYKAHWVLLTVIIERCPPSLLWERNEKLQTCELYRRWIDYQVNGAQEIWNLIIRLQLTPLTRELSSETLMTYITNTFPNRFNSSSFYGAPTCLNPYCEKMKPGVGGSRSVFGESVKTLTTPCRGKFQRSFVRGVVGMWLLETYLSRGLLLQE